MFDNNNVSDKSYLKPAERIEGCELLTLQKDTDTNSKSFGAAIFGFKGPNGETLDYKEFKPSRSINGKVLTDENLLKNLKMAHSRVAHITRAFLDEETFKKIAIKGDLSTFEKNWDEYISLTAQALGRQQDGTLAKTKGIKCALKVTLNGKYASFPKVPDFISTENHPKTFKTDPQYDKYVLNTIVPDKEQPATNFGASPAAPFGAAPTPEANAGGFGSAPATTHLSGF